MLSKRVTIDSPSHLYLFGYFELVQGGQHQSLPTRKTEALLAYLVLYPGSHARERIAALFWGDSSDLKARRSLRMALTALRKVLGETCLHTDRQTVQIKMQHMPWTDVVHFGEQARAFLANEPIDPTRIDLSLYRGELLPNFYDEWILRRREEFQQFYVETCLRIAQYWRVHGEYKHVIESASRVLQVDPAHEPAHQHLMFAYAAVGDRQAALRQYDECVRCLQQELAVGPSAETISLYRHIRQAASRASRGTVPLNNLPHPLTSLIGWASEIACMKALIQSATHASERPKIRLLTLTGSGGCGKTRLAIQLATELLDVFADGVWWVDLAALDDETAVVQSVARVLGTYSGEIPPSVEQLADQLRFKQTLLVLDNCEHLVGICASLCSVLLSRCSALQILITSREALNVTGETAWLVPPLSLPNRYQKVEASTLLQYEAVRLFVERAAALRSDFALTETNASAIVHICRRLDGIPLALELAATRLKLMTAEQMAARLEGVLDERFALLTNCSRSILLRQQTLRATIEWSYDLLNEGERRLLQRLSIFVDGWTLEAVEAIGVQAGEQSTIEWLARLVDKSLIVVENQDGVVRYRLLETIRHFAHEHLSLSGTQAAVRGVHLAYFLDLADRAKLELYGHSQLDWLRRLRMELANLRAALSWGLSDDPRAATDLLCGVRLTVALAPFWRISGDFAEGTSWLRKAMDRLDAHTGCLDEEQCVLAQLHGQILYHHGLFAWYQDQYEDAGRSFDASAETWRTWGDPLALAHVQLFQADLLYEHGEHAAAYALWHACVELFRKADHRWSVAWSLAFLTKAEHKAGRLALARHHCEESADLARAVGDRWLFTLLLSHLGMIAHKQGNYAEAKAYFEQRLTLGQEHDLNHHTHQALSFLAANLYAQGEVKQAAALFREAWAMRRPRDLKVHPPDTVLGLTSVDILTVIALGCAVEGRPYPAVKLLAAATSISYPLPAPDHYMGGTRYEQWLVELRDQLGAEHFAAAWAAGNWLASDEIVDEVLSI